MNKLNDLKAINVESDIENGFFWVEFENGNSLQCCLVAARQSEEEINEDGVVYLNQIHGWNNGFNDGVCFEINKWAASDEEGWDAINDFLIDKARSKGFQIVD